MNPDISVAHLRCASGGGGGADRVILNTVSRLQAGRFSQSVIYLARTESDVDGLVGPLRRQGLLCQVMPGRRVFDLLQFLALRRFVIGHGISILHCHDAKADVYGFLLRLIHPSLRVLSTLHGWTEKTRRGRLYSRLDKAMLMRFDAVIAVSEHTAGIAGRNGIPRVTVIHNGIDPDLWRPGPPEDGHSSDPPFTIAFVGRLSAEKGSMEFVELAREIEQRLPGSRFVVIGEGSELSAMKDAAEAAGLGDSFDFRGFQPPEIIRSVYPCIDVLALPSRREGLPMAVLEACAMGVCVAAFSVGGVPEIITHGHNGLLAQPGNIGELAGHILSLRRDKLLGDKLRRHARESIVEQFSVRNQVRQLEVVYAKLLDGGTLKVGKGVMSIP